MKNLLLLAVITIFFLAADAQTTSGLASDAFSISISCSLGGKYKAGIYIGEVVSIDLSNRFSILPGSLFYVKGEQQQMKVCLAYNDRYPHAPRSGSLQIERTHPFKEAKNNRQPPFILTANATLLHQPSAKRLSVSQFSTVRFSNSI